ncbi:MAG: hypothetical protein ACREIC_32950, partial [Limisphaerales bacterium]
MQRPLDFRTGSKQASLGNPTATPFPILFCILLLVAAGSGKLPAQSSPLPDGAATESPQQRRPNGRSVRGVYKSRVVPHWFHNNSMFWYRNDLHDGMKEFIVVNAERGSREL